MYIDDEKDDTTDAFRDGLQDIGLIDVDYRQAEDFGKQLAVFEKELNNYDGLIIDLRLDGNLSINLKHTAVSLAQELRAKTAAGEKYNDCPIVLCSTDLKIKNLYDKDVTSHDLFDYIILKEDKPDWGKHARKLKSIVYGYRALKTVGSDLAQIFSRDISKLDQRIFGKFLDSEEAFPIHDLAQLIIKEILSHPGPLINKYLLAARLGIDIEKSEDWETLIDKIFSVAKYKGAFSDGWLRWWSDLVLDKFKELTGKRLSALNASDRVNMLKEACKLDKLISAEPIANAVSTSYWTICEYYQKPLDPLEGFKIFAYREPKPWQEYRYLSFDAAAQRRGRIHPSEKNRLEEYKGKFPQK